MYGRALFVRILYKRGSDTGWALSVLRLVVHTVEAHCNIRTWVRAT